MTTKEQLDQIMAKAETIVQKWINDESANIDIKVTRMLENRLEEIVAKLMGFGTGRFSRDAWEVDNCNGRRGESAAGDFLRTKAKDAARAWLEAQAGKLPDLPKSAVASLKQDYREQLEKEVGKLLVEQAKQDASIKVAEYFKEMGL